MRYKYIRNIILITAAFFLLNYFLSDFLFPTLIQGFILPKINHKSQIKVDCEIRKASFFSFSAYNIKVHNSNTEIIKIDHLCLDYFLFGLFGISEIRIYGLEIFFPFSEKVSSKEKNGWTNYVLPIRHFLNKIEEFTPSFFIRTLNSNIFFKKFKDSKISIKNSKIFLRNPEGRIIYFPFELDGYISQGEKSELNLNANTLFGNSITTITMTNSGEFFLKTKLLNLQLNELSADFSGKLDADFSVYLSDRKKTIDISCDIRNLSTSSGNLSIRNSNEKITLSFNFDFCNEKAKFELTNMMLSGDFHVLVDFLSGECSFPESEKITINLLATLRLDKSNDNFSFSSEKISFRIDGELNQDILTFNVKKINNPNKVSMNLGDYRCQYEISAFDLKSEYKDNFNIKTSLFLSNLESKIKDGTLKIPEIKIFSEFNNGEFSGFAKIANAIYEKGIIKIINIEGIAKITNTASIEIDGNANNIKVGETDYGRASVKGNFDLSKRELKISGNYFLEKPSYNLPFQGIFAFSDKNKKFRITAKNDDYLKLDKFSLGRFAHPLQGFSAEGELKVNYELDYDSGILCSNFEKRLRNFYIENPSKELKIAGIDGEYISKDLSLMKTLPSMRFYAKDLSFGKVKLNNIELLYTLESPKSFYIEKLSAGWCGGNIYIFSTRINNSLRKDFTLYFDRVLLAEMLSEFGLCEGSGDGRVNGKVPFIIEGNDIEFKDAFFYSTPGTGGNIKVQKATALKDSINLQGEQLSPVDLTFEAL
ncbi:MAG TPA: YdbH domain-containing protein, partial [Victivallales bacterium]|nr:YdbH domain-containing protein [Victivallales bacterium]